MLDERHDRLSAPELRVGVVALDQSPASAVLAALALNCSMHHTRNNVFLRLGTRAGPSCFHAIRFRLRFSDGVLTVRGGDMLLRRSK